MRRKSLGGSGWYKERTGKRKRPQRVRNRWDEEHPQAEGAEVAPGESLTSPRGLLNREVRTSTARAVIIRRPDASRGQGGTEPEGMPDPEGPRGGETHLELAQAPSTEGSVLSSRIAYVGGVKSPKGSKNGRTIPGLRLSAHKPPEKAAKRPPPQAEPDTSSEEEIGQKGPSGFGKKKVVLPKPPRPPKRKLCPACGKGCLRLKAQSKPLNKDHLDTPISRRRDPKRYQRKSKIKRQKTDSGNSGYSTAGGARRNQAPVPKPKVSQFEPRTPGPRGGEESAEGRSIGDRAEEEFAASPTKNTEREARKPHEPQVPSHSAQTALPGKGRKRPLGLS